VRTKRGRFGGRGAAREKRADEPREQVATAAGRETGVAARHDMLGSSQIGDDGRYAFEQDGALELRGRASRGGPAIVRRFVGERVTGEDAELS
jgi:hypothetical protein